MSTETHTTYGPANIDPAEWTWLGNFYLGDNDEASAAFAGDHEQLELNLAAQLGLGRWEEGRPAFVLSSTVRFPDKRFVKDDDVDLFNLVFDNVTFHDNGGCASCGARFMYGSVFVRGESELVAVGHDCASNLFGLTDLSQKAKRNAAKARKARKVREKFAAQIEDDEELKAAFDLRWTGNIVDHPKDGNYLQGSGAGIVQDIYNKGNRYGSISDRQADLVKKIAREHHERQAEREAEEAERGSVEDIPVTDGRLTIEGTVISHRWDESIYGDTHKMLVESADGRWRVWGTVPSKIDDAIIATHYDEDGLPSDNAGELKGSKVRFTARVEVSRDDSTFGFYKRPTKPELIEAGHE